MSQQQVRELRGGAIWLLLLFVVFVTYSYAAQARSSYFERYANVHSEGWTDEYDDYFRKYTKRYFGPHFDWRWFKAQAIAESGLQHDIKSHAGAIGLMQILPSTFEEIRGKNPHYIDIKTPRWNIAAGIYYDHYLYRKWPDLPELERLYLTFASYNAGFGGALRAYKRANPPVESWQAVSPHAPKETQGYVKRIRTLRNSDLADLSPRVRGLNKYLLGTDSN